MKLPLLIALLLLSPTLVTATSLDLSGVIGSQLSPTHDTIRITASTTIAKGASLRLNAGKVLRFANGASLIVKGSLRLLGTVSDSVRVEAVSGSWGGIEIDNYNLDMGADSSVFQYASISGARSAALTVRDYNAVFVTHSRFHRNRNGNSAPFSRGGAICAVNASFRVESSLFEANRDTVSEARGGAISWIGGTAIIRNSIFRKDTARLGGAIYAENMDSIVVEHSRFYDQEILSYPGFGGSIYAINSRTYIRNSHFSYGNSFMSYEQYRAIGIYDTASIVFHMVNDTVTGYRGASSSAPILSTGGDSILIENSIFYDNKINPLATLVGGTLHLKARAIQLSGILAYHNSADKAAFAYVSASGYCNLVHSTIVNNNAGALPVISIGTGSKTPTIHGSILWGNSVASPVTEGYGFLNVIQGIEQAAYPEFVDSASGDFRLKANSPYIDGGYALAPGIPSKDLDGFPRSKYWSPDPGAYEYQGSRPNMLMGVFSRDTLLPKANYSVGGPCLRILDGKVLRIAAGSQLTFDKNCLEVYGSLRVEGTSAEPVVFTSSNPQGWKGVKIDDVSWHTITDVDSSSIRYLQINNTSGNAITQQSYSTASYAHVQFTAANGGGRFGLEAQSKADVDSCTFQGTGGGMTSAANLKSQGSQAFGPGLTFEISESALLNGWIFEKSAIHFSQGTQTLRNSILDSSTITNGSNPLTLVNILSYGNGPNVPAIEQTYGDLRIIHSTIVDNEYYGISVSAGSLLLRNSILWGNYGGEGIPQLSVGSSVNSLVKNSLIQNGWIGEQILNSNPQFVASTSGNYAPAAGSPVVDQADSTGVIALMNGLDLAGKSRFRGPKMDLGAYELQSGTVHNLWQNDTPVSIWKPRQLQPIMKPVPRVFDLLGRRLHFP